MSGQVTLCVCMTRVAQYAYEDPTVQESGCCSSSNAYRLLRPAAWRSKHDCIGSLYSRSETRRGQPPGGCPLLMCMLLPASTQGVMQCLLGCERTCTGPWHVCLATCQVCRHTSCASNMYIMMTWTSFHVMMTSRYDQGILCGQLLGEGHSAASGFGRQAVG